MLVKEIHSEHSHSLSLNLKWTWNHEKKELNMKALTKTSNVVTLCSLEK